jgi:hypothetical protein
MLRKVFLIGVMGLLFCGLGNAASDYYSDSILNDKVDLLIPKYLIKLPEDVAVEKSNAIVPTIIYVSKNNSVNISITYRKFAGLELHQENPQEILKVLQDQNYNDIAWINKQVVKLETKKTNGRNFGIRHIKSVQVTGEVTETQYITSLGGYQILFSFSYPSQQDDVWDSIREKVFSSIVIHE